MSSGVVYRFASFRLDAGDRLLLHQERAVALTPKAFDTLLVLVERHGRLVTKDDLFQAVWPDAFVEENNLAQHISALRKVLGEEPGGPFIETVPKKGYRFVAPVVLEPAVNSELPVARDAQTPTRAMQPAVTTSPVPPVINGSRGALRQWIAFGALSILMLIALEALLKEGGSGATRAGSGRRDPATVTRIAVLPFSNLGAAGNDLFVAGLTEEIVSRLANLQQVAVPSSTTISSYGRTGKTARQVGADLGVDYIVEGSVRSARSGPGEARVRVTPRLVRVADDTAVWTHAYDAPLGDLLGVQTDIAQQITSALQVALDARERRALSARPTEDSEAYLSYLSGLAFAQQGASDTASIAQARAAMERAVARDPRFALAWSWLARVKAWQYGNGSLRSIETRQAAEHAARTAIALAPELPEAHLGIAEVRIRDRDYIAARREIEVVRAGLPNSPDVWRLIGHIEERSGRWLESRSAYLRGFEVDPPTLSDPLAVHYLHLRQYDESRRYVDIARAANRSGVVVPDAWGRFSDRGDIPAARDVLETALESRTQADGRVLAFLARLEWFDGRHERALDLIAKMDPAGAWLAPNFRFPAAIAAGQVYESLGRAGEAKREFEAALDALEVRASAGADYQVEAAIAFAMAGLERRADAIQHAERAVALLPVTTDAAEGMLYLYVLAMVQSRVGDAEVAMATLNRLYEIPGFYSEAWVAREPWFANLRRLPSYRGAAARWATRRGEALLRAE